VLAERAFLRALGGGCLLPIAALGKVDGDQLTLRGSVSSPNGRERLFAPHSGPLSSAESIGAQLAERLLEQGARRLLT
jgi:hydroxymethylbilane synthase